MFHASAWAAASPENHQQGGKHRRANREEQPRTEGGEDAKEKGGEAEGEKTEEKGAEAGKEEAEQDERELGEEGTATTTMKNNGRAQGDASVTRTGDGAGFPKL